MKMKKLVFVAMGVFLFVVGTLVFYYVSIPTPNEKRWETYCYPNGELADVKTIVEYGGYDLNILTLETGQKGFWYLKGEIKTEPSSCLLMNHWYTQDFDGDGIKDKGFPFAEYIEDSENHCCTRGGF